MGTDTIPDDLEQRLIAIRNHLHDLALEIDALEADLLARNAPQSDGERAATAARAVIYRQGPSEVKVIR